MPAHEHVYGARAQSFLVVTNYYKGDKTLYHVWLDSMSHIYVAIGCEKARALQRRASTPTPGA